MTNKDWRKYKLTKKNIRERMPHTNLRFWRDCSKENWIRKANPFDRCCKRLLERANKKLVLLKRIERLGGNSKGNGLCILLFKKSCSFTLLKSWMVGVKDCYVRDWTIWHFCLLKEGFMNWGCLMKRLQVWMLGATCEITLINLWCPISIQIENIYIYIYTNI